MSSAARRLVVTLLPILALLWPSTGFGIQIVDTPFDPAAVIHNAESAGGAAGAVVAHVELDKSFGAGNDWNLTTGGFQARFDLFDDAARTNAIGTAFAVGFVDPVALGTLGASNTVVATLFFTFDLSADPTSDFYALMESDFGPKANDIWQDIPFFFADIPYVVFDDNLLANSFQGDNLTLWGASGNFIGSSLLGGPGGFGGFGDSARIGIDLALELPEPTPSILLGIAGLAVLAGRRRRSA